MTRDARYHCDLSGATISSTSPEHYNWRLDERKCRPSYLRISLIGIQRPRPSSVGRIPLATIFFFFFYDAPRIFSATSTRRRTSRSRNSLAYLFSFFSLSFFFFWLRSRMHLHRTPSDVEHVCSSHQLVTRIVDEVEVLSGVARDRSCASQTRHDDTCSDVFWIKKQIALRSAESHDDGHFNHL